MVLLQCICLTPKLLQTRYVLFVCHLHELTQRLYRCKFISQVLVDHCVDLVTLYRIVQSVEHQLSKLHKHYALLSFSVVNRTLLVYVGVAQVVTDKLSELLVQWLYLLVIVQQQFTFSYQIVYSVYVYTETLVVDYLEHKQVVAVVIVTLYDVVDQSDLMLLQYTLENLVDDKRTYLFMVPLTPNERLYVIVVDVSLQYV